MHNNSMTTCLHFICVKPNTMILSNLLLNNSLPTPTYTHITQTTTNLHNASLRRNQLHQERYSAPRSRIEGKLHLQPAQARALQELRADGCAQPARAYAHWGHA